MREPKSLEQVASSFIKEAREDVVVHINLLFLEEVCLDQERFRQKQQRIL